MVKTTHLNVSGEPHDKDIRKLLGKPETGTTKYVYRAFSRQESTIAKGGLSDLEFLFDQGWEPVFCDHVGLTMVFLLRMPKDEWRDLCGEQQPQRTTNDPGTPLNCPTNNKK